MPVYRYTMVFQMTTVASQPAFGTQHSAGWTESFWTLLPILDPELRTAAAQRSVCLAGNASIVGIRKQTYDIIGNKLLPQGASLLGMLRPGNGAYPGGLPQAALLCSASANGAPNTSRFTLRGIPTTQLAGGEYNPDAAFAPLVEQWLAYMISPPAYAFIGRVLTASQSLINSISAGGVVATQAAIAGIVPNQSYIRLRKVKDSTGRPISGAFLVTATTGLTNTLANWGGQTVGASGIARIDLINVFPMQLPKTVRAMVRKVGRPSQSYRGRRSKRRAA